jgi:predicted ATP-grasp superfamily ATP-dependent carboligase
VAHAATPDELARTLARFPDAAFPVLLQERVVGPGIGVFLLIWDGRVRAQFSHRRIREKPPAGGVSVYGESIASDPALVEKSAALLDRFGWCGVAMVEYKVDERTGTPVLMEINGRFWGSLQLAIDAGVDFPRLLIECAQGRVPSAPPAYEAGVRLKWWWGDVDHLLARLRHSDAALGLVPGSPSRLRAVRDFLRGGAADRSETYRRDDPGPFRHETLAWFRGR